MCGLCGCVNVGRPEAPRDDTVRRMAATLTHRGPDGEGFVAGRGCALGFRRLAIIDVDASAPPFSNENDTVWSVCNGEIYNSDGIRDELERDGHRFRTAVDTEVIPHLYEQHGSGLVERLNGMFTLAVWDTQRELLLLARDRAGEKPLFYWHDDDRLVFASELGALLAHPEVPRAVDPVAIRRYLLHGFFPAPLSPIAGIRKLPAGHTLVARRGEFTVRPYWDLADHFGSPEARRRSAADLAVELDHRISVAVERRRRSDVPVGLFLSGGLDSATLLAHMTEQSGPGVPVFSLGHSDDRFDESSLAARTAAHFKADYRPLVLDERALEEGLQRVGERMDEPLGDASTIPTHLLAAHARQHVKVVLAGEGADELFGGYPTYLGDRVAEMFGRLPGWARSALGASLKRLMPVSMSNVGPDFLVRKFLLAAERPRIERHHGWFGILPPESHADILAPTVVEALRDDDPFEAARRRLRGRALPDALAELLYTDFTMYLQDDLLTKVDRATMLVSLEARAPFLDHDLAEFAAGLPSRLKVRGLNTKAILRRAARRRLPDEVLRRRKRGFNIPFSRLLLHGLGERLRQRFSRERVEARGLLSAEGVARTLDAHLARRADHGRLLFTLTMLDLWCDRTYGEGTAVPLAQETAAADARAGVA